MSSGVSVNWNSVSATRGDKATRSIQSSFHHEESSSQSNSPQQQLSPLGHVPSSNSSISDDGSDNTPLSCKATKRDKLAGKVGKVVAKFTHDPELHDRAMLREIGGKELADGLTMVNSTTL